MHFLLYAVPNKSCSVFTGHMWRYNINYCLREEVWFIYNPLICLSLRPGLRRFKKFKMMHVLFLSLSLENSLQG